MYSTDRCDECSGRDFFSDFFSDGGCKTYIILIRDTYDTRRRGLICLKLVGTCVNGVHKIYNIYISPALYTSTYEKEKRVRRQKKTEI